MELAELKSIWQAYDTKLATSLRLNLQVLEQIGLQKVASSFDTLVRYKLFSIILGIAWVIFLGTLIFRFPSEPVFVASLAAIILFTIIAIAGYTYQVVLVKQISFRDPILETQRKLALLQASLIRITRILFLQAPFYATFFVSKNLLLHGGILFWVIEGSILALLILASVWLYRNISFKNLNRPFIKTIIENEGGKSIAKAARFIREIEGYKEELAQV